MYSCFSSLAGYEYGKLPHPVLGRGSAQVFALAGSAVELLPQAVSFTDLVKLPMMRNTMPTSRQTHAATLT